MIAVVSLILILTVAPNAVRKRVPRPPLLMNENFLK